MKKMILTLIFLWTTGLSNSFAGTISRDSLTAPVSWKNNIKITPFRLLLSHPGLELAYEHRFGEELSAQLSLAALYDISFIGEEAFPSSGSGYQVSLEEKYFFKQTPNRFFFALETGYYNIRNSSYSVSHKLDSSSLYVGTRQIYYLTPKVGIQFPHKNGFLLEIYAGVGVKYQEERYVNQDNRSDAPSDKFWMIKVPMNMRIGFEF